MNYLRYALAHIATAVGAVALFWAIRVMFDFDIAPSILPVLPSMVAAMAQGGSFAQANGRAPDGGAAWQFAVMATLISVALLALYYVVLGAAYPAFISTLMARIGLSILGPTLMALFVVVIFLVNRYFLTFNARVTLKAAAKRVGKP